MDAKLVVVGGGTQVRHYDLRLPAVIGRSRSNDVTLGHPLVSRHHCELFEKDGYVMVRDLGSLNGTFVGETRIAEHAVSIQPGDLITVGPVTLRAVYRAGDNTNGHDSTWNADGPTCDGLPPGSSDEFRDTPSRGVSFETGHGGGSPGGV